MQGDAKRAVAVEPSRTRSTGHSGLSALLQQQPSSRASSTASTAVGAAAASLTSLPHTPPYTPRCTPRAPASPLSQRGSFNSKSLPVLERGGDNAAAALETHSAFDKIRTKLDVPDTKAIIDHIRSYCESGNPLDEGKIYDLCNAFGFYCSIFNEGRRTLGLGGSYAINPDRVGPGSLNDDPTTSQSIHGETVYPQVRTVTLHRDDKAAERFLAFVLGRLLLDQDLTFWVVFIDPLSRQLYALHANGIDEEERDMFCSCREEEEIIDGVECTCIQDRDVFGHDPSFSAVLLGSVDILKEVLIDPSRNLEWEPIRAQDWSSVAVSKARK